MPAAGSVAEAVAAAGLAAGAAFGVIETSGVEAFHAAGGLFAGGAGAADGMAASDAPRVSEAPTPQEMGQDAHAPWAPPTESAGDRTARGRPRWR